MMQLFPRRIFRSLAPLSVLILTLGVSPARAQGERPRKAETPQPRASAKQLKDAGKRAASAAKVFDEIMDANDSSVPKELLDRAEAVAVFPGMLKGGFIVGGRGGTGIISRRVAGGWGPPAYFRLTGASIGPQIGASKTDLVLLFMNESALKGLLEDKFEIGGEASAAAGPVGRSAAATTNVTLDAGILSYSRSKGLFAGLELKGAWINPDNNLNEALYGLKARDLLTGATKVNMADVPSGIIIFPNTLARYSIK